MTALDDLDDLVRGLNARPNEIQAEGGICAPMSWAPPFPVSEYRPYADAFPVFTAPRGGIRFAIPPTDFTAGRQQKPYRVRRRVRLRRWLASYRRKMHQARQGWRGELVEPEDDEW